MKVWCISSELWPILYNFGYEIQNSVAMATFLVNFRKYLKLAILQYSATQYIYIQI